MLSIGRIVSTFTGCGPYKILKISEMCCGHDCHLGAEGCTEPHYHITCQALGERNESYLDGYRADGTSVWNESHLIFHPVAVGENYDLFSD